MEWLSEVLASSVTRCPPGGRLDDATGPTAGPPSLTPQASAAVKMGRAPPYDGSRMRLEVAMALRTVANCALSSSIWIGESWAYRGEVGCSAASSSEAVHS